VIAAWRHRDAREVAPTNDPTTWRPATAFDASRHQQTIFRRRVR
jgi:hypothetical protein